MTKEDIYNKYPQPHFRSDTIQMMEEYSKSVLESKIKDIEKRKEVTIDEAVGYGLNLAIEILKKGI